MRAPRVSIAGLMGVVLVASIGLAALRSSSFLWSRVISTLVVATLFLSVLAARYRRGARGAFWFGFAVLGWGYFIIVFTFPAWGADVAALAATTGYDDTGPNLLTKDLVGFLVRYGAKIPKRGEGFLVDQSMEYMEKAQSSVVIGHQIMTLLVACAGGLAAQFLASREGNDSGDDDRMR